MAGKAVKFDYLKHYRDRIVHLWRKAPFVLRITRHKGIQGPLLVVKERVEASEGNPQGQGVSLRLPIPLEPKTRLVERGYLFGEAQRTCLGILRKIVSKVCDPAGVPLELERYLTKDGLKYCLNFPLDEEAGAKLALIFKLQERLSDQNRIELIARRVALFSREEAGYWLSRITSFGPDANRWAVAGLRLVLGGQPHDRGVGRMLEKLRSQQ